MEQTDRCYNRELTERNFGLFKQIPDKDTEMNP